MQLIVGNKVLSKTFARLIDTYSNMSFAVAWASAATPAFQQLIAKPKLIRNGVIGTHFYQTHPDVLDTFVGSSAVKFILNPEGVFHPKIYLFWNNDGWEALVGSANLTFAALTVNSEAVLHVTSSDPSTDQLKQQLLSAIESYWPLAEASSKESARAYRAIWSSKQASLKRLSGQYGKTKAHKTPVQSAIMSMSWKEFLVEVRKGPFHDIDERVDLLGTVRSAFDEQPRFSSMDLGVRKTIAGLPTEHDERWGWFGSMRGAGYFHQAINENNSHISIALDHVPQHGLVTRAQYDKYLEAFIKAFPNGRDGIGIASRLLALKRPDQFVCFDSKNKAELCNSFGIPKTGMNYERYWDEIVERILDSPWWLADRPRGGKDRAIWDGRAAMLDCIFYRP